MESYHGIISWEEDIVVPEEDTVGPEEDTVADQEDSVAPQEDFFFEEDLLFHLSFHDIKIKEIPIKTIYYNKSNLNPLKSIFPFLIKHIKNSLKRIKYEFSK